MSYWRFAAMIATSTVVMFGLMYLNTYLVTHVFWSETRVYMALLMGATMAIIMLSFMLSMYSNKAINAAIFVGAAVAFAGSLWLVRSQVTVADTSYMRAMIPHHSIAVMTSNRANISDPRVRKLADEIIFAQDKEIAEMRYLINSIEASGKAVMSEEQPTATIVSLDQALSTAHVEVLDPGFLSPQDIAALFPNGQSCSFTYTTDSAPVLAIGDVAGQTAGLVKLSGDLVRLDVASATELSVDGLTIRIGPPTGEDDATLAPVGTEPSEADMHLELDEGLTAGYRGFYACRS
ncbi:DUF305 domain-containing protein [Pseudosulfitobacter koreensis]|uniref:DUF305 domain-containing protein n=1 Tax=Pseudosulfitobacter koreensis TaxID=2968472 RepID=A0ABT1Z455_9RHOB|nr:DUF305 domain-containing protein [Pseudosulfitobacter koreense]MCR8827919.1 DUF305 domain-containing protein [Pseudosulfitobacter koreense]